MPSNDRLKEKVERNSLKTPFHRAPAAPPAPKRPANLRRAPPRKRRRKEKRLCAKLSRNTVCNGCKLLIRHPQLYQTHGSRKTTGDEKQTIANDLSEPHARNARMRHAARAHRNIRRRRIIPGLQPQALRCEQSHNRLYRRAQC